MHLLQPKQTKLTEKEMKELVSKFNISVSQLPKINKKDPSLPEGTKTGDIIKIERSFDGTREEYYRLVV